MPTLTDAPFWYFGKKRRAADLVWKALGDVDVYIEPFGGSATVLLQRPHPPARDRVEIVNDIDGYVVNFFRAVQAEPDTVVQWASWPITEIDFNARRMELIQWRLDGAMEQLWTDMSFYNAKIAGIWVWAHNLAIAGPVTHTNGPWWRSSDRKLIYREAARRGRKQPSDVGISLSIPNISTFRGLLHPDIAADGIGKALPTVEDALTAFFTPREELPPALSESVSLDADDVYTLVEEKARLWLRILQARLRYTIFLCRSWDYLVRETVLRNAVGMSNRMKQTGTIGIFLDPPYSFDVRDARNTDIGSDGLYLYDMNIAAHVRDWCKVHGNNPSYRIVLAGFDGEGHEELEQYGWSVARWWKNEATGRGYQNIRKADNPERTQQHRERLWISPHCLPIDTR